VLLVFGAPCQHPLLVGREHGRTIPLVEEMPEADRTGVETHLSGPRMLPGALQRTRAHRG
jgi:hypothetical protein